ncbi:MAG: NAD(P)/FAD-dependent oxidoreductase [Fusobacterium sp.]|nr:NAD(P)/FAD-dependent oxidoreductase [Fusobacterium sp.]
MSEKIYDLGIIGGGPAGYTAALHARKNGLSVVLFEKDKLGGVCLNRGCIPTKTILHSAEFFSEINCAADLGVLVEGAQVDFSAIMARKDAVVEKLRRNLELSIKNAKIDVVNAFATFKDRNHIEADGEIYECAKVIVSTGSTPRELPHIKFDHEFVLSSDDVLALTELPKSILIIGSGAIGIEWARIFSSLGAEVAVVEVGKNLLPIADIEVSKRVERMFKAKKIKFYTGTSVDKIENGTVQLSNGEALQPEKVLMSVGRMPLVTEKLEGVEYLGDVSGGIQLAHCAIKEAIRLVDGVAFDETLVPSVIYGTPEIAWVGVREQDLEAGTFEKSSILISALGKSHCDNCTDGFIKIISQNGLIVGAHIVSKEASSLIHQVLIAIQNKIPAEKLREICFAHPTYSEGIFEVL